MSNIKYDETIAEGEAMLKRIEAKAREVETTLKKIETKARRVRDAIEELREMRDAGEPWTTSAARIDNTELAHY